MSYADLRAPYDYLVSGGTPMMLVGGLSFFGFLGNETLQVMIYGGVLHIVLDGMLVAGFDKMDMNRSKMMFIQGIAASGIGFGAQRLYANV